MTQSKRYIASYDFGTSGCKAALVTVDGKIKHSVAAGYPFITPQKDYAEQDPQVYWNALTALTPQLLDAAGVSAHDIAAVVCSTIWKGIIPIDEQGNVLGNSILWLDGRAEKQAAFLKAHLDAECLSRKDYWPKLLWCKQNRPETYEKTAHILDVNGYLKFRLTGELAVDVTGSFMRSTDRRSSEFYADLADLCGFDMQLFPPLVRSTDMVGRVTPAASEQTGLATGTPVFGGCTDLAAITLGSGSSAYGDAHVYLGTSGWYGQVTPVSQRLHCCLAAPLSEDADLTFYGLNAACTSTDWAVNTFYARERAEMGSGVYAFLEQELEKVPAGSDGLLATTWLYGERPPVNRYAHAMFMNMSYQHDRRHFVRAMRESVAYMLRWKRELTENVSMMAGQSIRAVGGGAKSKSWMQILADVMRVPVEVPPEPQFVGTIGAAACALVGLGELNGYGDVRSLRNAEYCLMPRETNSRVYEKMYDAYRSLNTMDGVFDKMHDLEIDDET